MKRQEKFSIRKSNRGAFSTCIAVLSFLALGASASSVSADGLVAEPVSVAEPVATAVEAVSEELVAHGVYEEPGAALQAVSEEPEAHMAEQTADYAQAVSEEPVTESVAEPKSESVAVVDEVGVLEPVTDDNTTDYYQNLLVERTRFEDELAKIEAQIAEIEKMAEEERRYGFVLSDSLNSLVEELEDVQNRLKDLDNEIKDLEDELNQINQDITSRQNELDNLEKNDPQAVLLNEIEDIEKAISDKEGRIKEIDKLIAAKQEALKKLSDEKALDQDITNKTNELSKLTTELNKLRRDRSAKIQERDAYKTVQEKKIESLKQQLQKAGAPSTTTVEADKKVWDSRDMRGYSEQVWKQTKQTHELVRFTGDREVIIELTEEQSKEYDATKTFTYTINPAKVEEYFLLYVEEIRKNNGITIPANQLAAASDYARRRAEENAKDNNLTHATTQTDKSRYTYENAGALTLNMLEKDLKSDQELAYHLAFEWFADYNNVAKKPEDHYGHRDNLLGSSRKQLNTKNSTGQVVKTEYAIPLGNGLGLADTPLSIFKVDGVAQDMSSDSGWLHYLQNGYDWSPYYPANYYTHASYDYDRQGSFTHYTIINGKKTPTVFMDALKFVYVQKGATTTTINQEYLKIEKELKDVERDLETELKKYETEIDQLDSSIKTKGDNHEKLSDELKDLKDDKANLTKKRQNLQTEINTLNKEKQNLTQDINSLKGVLTTKQSQVNPNTPEAQRRQDLKNELKTLNDRKTQVEQDLTQKRAERGQLLGQEFKLQGEIKTLKDKIQKQDEFNKRIEDLLKGLRRDRSGLNAKKDQNEDRIDDIERYSERRKLNEIDRKDIDTLFETDEESKELTDKSGRVTILDSNGTGVSVNLSKEEGVVKVVVVKHIEPTATTPNPVERLAGKDFDLYDIKLIDENGNYVTDLKYTAIVKLPVDNGKVVERVIYLPDEGEAEDLDILLQDDNFVYFVAEHFSFYGVIYRSVPKGTFTPPTKDKDTTPGTIDSTGGEQVHLLGTGQGTSTDTYSRVARHYGEKTLPNTGGTFSMLGFLGSVLTATGLVGIKKRRKG